MAVHSLNSHKSLRRKLYGFNCTRAHPRREKGQTVRRERGRRMLKILIPLSELSVGDLCPCTHVTRGSPSCHQILSSLLRACESAGPWKGCHFTEFCRTSNWALLDQRRRQALANVHCPTTGLKSCPPHWQGKGKDSHGSQVQTG